MVCLERIRMAGTAAVAVAAMATSVTTSAADGIRVIGAFGADHTSTAAMQRFAGVMADTTLGRFEVEVESGVEGGSDAVLDALRNGEATLAWLELDALAELAPAFGVVTLPFLYRDQEQVFSMLEWPHIGPLLNDELRKQGLVALGYMDGGPLHLTATGALPQSVADLEGRRIAVQGGDLRVGAFEALGLEAVPVPGETLPDDVDAYELSYAEIGASGLDPGALRVARAPHGYDPIVVLANVARYDELSIDQEETIKLKVQEVVSWQRGAAERDATVALDRLEKGGITVASLPDALMAEARERVVRFVRDSEIEADDAIVEAVLAYAG